MNNKYAKYRKNTLKAVTEVAFTKYALLTIILHEFFTSSDIVLFSRLIPVYWPLNSPSYCKKADMLI